MSKKKKSTEIEQSTHNDETAHKRDFPHNGAYSNEDQKSEILVQSNRKMLGFCDLQPDSFSFTNFYCLRTSAERRHDQKCPTNIPEKEVK